METVSEGVDLREGELEDNTGIHLRKTHERLTQILLGHRLLSVRGCRFRQRYLWEDFSMCSPR